MLVQMFLSALLLIIGYGAKLKGISLHGVEHAASCYCLYYIGRLLSRHQFWKGWEQFPYIAVSAAAFLILLWLNPRGSIELGKNSYQNPAFLLAASVSGWFLLFCVATFVNYLPIRNVFVFLGQHTMPVVLLHLLSFKLVAVVVASAYHLPNFCIAAFLNLYGSRGLWWLAYTVVGVLVPVALSVCSHVGLSRWSKARL